MLQKSQAAPPQQLTPEQVTRPQRSKPKQLSASARIWQTFSVADQGDAQHPFEPILLVLVAYAFTFAIYAAATGARTKATNLAVGGSTKTAPTCHAALRTASLPPGSSLR